jgi:hypothetical protein
MAATGIEAIGMVDPISVEKMYSPSVIFQKVDYRVLVRRKV